MSGTRRKVALVTGASAGIGRALALGFARAGYDVILTARRADRLAALAAEIGPGARVATADLREPTAPAALFAQTGPVDILVNNAGLGAAGRFDRASIEQAMTVVQVNIAALTALTRLYLPDMVARRAGRVLNVASIAGFQPGPGLAVYCATKAYVLSLSEALHAELAGTGVTVTCLCPGATRTEFADVAGLDGSKLFKLAMSAEAVARQGIEATLAGRRLVVPGIGNRIGTIGVRFIPRGLVLSIASRIMSGAT